MTREESWQVDGVTLTLLRHVTSPGGRDECVWAEGVAYGFGAPVSEPPLPGSNPYHDCR